jgi:hypothetical protein
MTNTWNSFKEEGFSFFLFLQYWVLNSGPTPWATPPAFFCAGFFQDRISQTICPGWLWTMIFLISTSWVASSPARRKDLFWLFSEVSVHGQLIPQGPEARQNILIAKAYSRGDRSPHGGQEAEGKGQAGTDTPKDTSLVTYFLLLAPPPKFFNMWGPSLQHMSLWWTGHIQTMTLTFEEMVVASRLFDLRTPLFSVKRHGACVYSCVSPLVSLLIKSKGFNHGNSIILT